ncbi:hypothetical protein [Kribbella sp. ALI-6-A]|uniref:hypothetical protein n=1 Tax=Kribbella sp. ALI-6-A TaxID=1933817 RepID=UPI00117B209B|nr:hypothetical protein [Kribbella sp. ALI-6-A]
MALLWRCFVRRSLDALITAAGALTAQLQDDRSRQSVLAGDLKDVDPVLAVSLAGCAHRAMDRGTEEDPVNHGGQPSKPGDGQREDHSGGQHGDRPCRSGIVQSTMHTSPVGVVGGLTVAPVGPSLTSRRYRIW